MAQTTTPAPASRRTHGVDAAIGNTPLIPLRRIASGEGAGVWVKLEGRNPGGSVKDRPALWIVRAAENAGALAPGRTLLDASSGNTGIAYAMLCAARGYGCEICIPRNASEERKGLLRAYGADLVLTDPAEGQDGAIRQAEARAREEPERYFYARQYDNPANPRAHYESTGPEIWRQTEGRITDFVAALGTSGTFMGTGRKLLEENPTVRLVAVQPDSPFHGL
ncbi:MAG TPA: PLP-dependent cysteine synthase family protein, partial [Longimicrobiales bacterium]|nr:PLP-dependent cysteine synthase family protein [Longimicrobiales bacterium]